VILKFKVNVDDRFINVSLEAPSPNDYAPIEYQGAPDDVKKFKNFIELQCGAFGHTLGSTTTPIDFHRAMLYQKQFPAELIEGKIDKYDPDIPVGAKT
jgi:hypothetical protein